MRWIKRIFSRGSSYDEITESIRQHLEERTEDLIQGGLSKEEAGHEARREFGNVTLIEERSREVWQWQTLESVWCDGKQAVRQLRRNVGFTVAVGLTLALSIGVI